MKRVSRFTLSPLSLSGNFLWGSTLQGEMFMQWIILISFPMKSFPDDKKKTLLLHWFRPEKTAKNGGQHSLLFLALMSSSVKISFFTFFSHIFEFNWLQKLWDPRPITSRSVSMDTYNSPLWKGKNSLPSSLHDKKYGIVISLWQIEWPRINDLFGHCHWSRFYLQWETT